MHNFGHGFLQTIERAFHTQRALLQNVRIDHGGAQVGVAEQFLDGPNIAAGLQKMRREAVSKRVRSHSFLDVSILDRPTQRLAKNAFMQMMAMR